MPLSKHIKLLIHVDGTCSVEAVHFADATCTQATQQILQVLAGQVTAERLKPQAQRLPPRENRQREGGR